jgi:phosphopantetheinyl transferase (holo-ACP synthase)
LVRRLYTSAEQALTPAPPLAAEFFAGRFAAKEAVLKALGTGWVRGMYDLLLGKQYSLRRGFPPRF